MLRASALASSIQRVGSKIVSVTSSGLGFVTMSLTDLTGGLDAAPIAGDMVIVMAAVADGTDYTMSIGSGYTLVGSELKGAGPGANLRVALKTMSGSPDTSVTIDFGANSTPGVVAARVYRGFDAGTPLDVTTTTATGGVGSGKPNPPSISPLTPGSLILAIGAGGNNGSYADLTSSDLSNFASLTHASTYNTLLGFGDVVWGGSGAFDPAEFGGSTPTSGWAALTMAIRST